tara:strand:- start:11913 stop:12449 length:537 start_codon:yes stop_codon:yes gene_type:complete
MQNSEAILAVDLDHTLIDTDMIHLGLKYMFLHRVYLIPYLIILFFMKGKPRAKKFLYDNTEFSIKNLPYNNSVINFIKNNRKEYTHVILISGSYYRYVESIAHYLDIFDLSVGTTSSINMISFNKINYIKNKYNNIIFDYIGDSKKDIPIWEESRNAFVVDRKNITKYLSHINYKIIS